MKKRISLRFNLFLRLLVSIIYFIAYILFNNLIFRIGRLSDIGLQNGLIGAFLIIIMQIMLMCSTESLYTFIDPINKINAKKYRLIFALQLLVMVSNSLILMNENFTKKIWDISNGLILFLGMFVVIVHFCIIKSYDNLMFEEREKMISEYQMEQDQQLLNIMSEVKGKLYVFLGYLIMVGVCMKYPLMNIYTSITFLLLNVYILRKLFMDVLTNLYKKYDKTNTIKGTMLLTYICSSIAYITLFLISKDIIHITLFEGRTPDEIAMVWFLSFYPLFSKLIKFYTIELRMTRKWEL